MKRREKTETAVADHSPAPDGRDEMNLVECPLSAVSDRFLDGRKTVVFQDQVWDPDRKAFLKRELAISGSDRYGLPTAKDEDVLLACVQLSARQDFRDREVRFSRYELLKLLHWPDEGKSYQRVSRSLRRWKGVAAASSTKADGYHRLRVTGGPAFQHYRRAVLRDHYERTARA